MKCIPRQCLNGHEAMFRTHIKTTKMAGMACDPVAILRQTRYDAAGLGCARTVVRCKGIEKDWFPFFRKRIITPHRPLAPMTGTASIPDWGVMVSRGGSVMEEISAAAAKQRSISVHGTDKYSNCREKKGLDVFKSDFTGIRHLRCLISYIRRA